MTRYERYTQVDVDDVLDMILRDDLISMESLYFEANYGKQAQITKAVGLSQSFALDKIYRVKWFIRETYSEAAGKYLPYVNEPDFDGENEFSNDVGKFVAKSLLDITV